MRSRLRAFGAFWYDFVIGDDWLVALAVAVALAATYALTAWVTDDAWWVVPLAVVVVLPISLVRAIRVRP